MKNKTVQYSAALVLLICTAVGIGFVLDASPDAGQLYHDACQAQDGGEKLQLMEKAAENGCVAAQTELGVMYQHGLYGPQDLGKAVKWFRMAAAKDDPTATVNLGFLVLRGEGTERNEAEAKSLANKFNS